MKSGSPAEKAGLKRGDRILTVAGDAGRDVGQLRHRDRHAAEPRRRSRPSCATVKTQSRDAASPSAEGKYEVGDIGVVPDATPMVASVIKGDVAEKAGLKAGDLMLAVNGEPMTQPTQLTDAISRNAGKPTRHPRSAQRPGDAHHA